MEGVQPIVDTLVNTKPSTWSLESPNITEDPDKMGQLFAAQAELQDIIDANWCMEPG